MDERAVYLPDSRRAERRKLQKFLEFVTTFGYIVKGKAGDIHPRALQSILDEVRDRPEETVISTVMLRSMKQAKYDPQSLVFRAGD